MTCPILANSVDPDQLASEDTDLGKHVIKYVPTYTKGTKKKKKKKKTAKDLLNNANAMFFVCFFFWFSL